MVIYALITGGNRGIGFAIAEELSRRGVFIFLAARKPEKAQEALQTLHKAGGQGKAIELDVTSIDSIEHAKTVIQAETGYLDILVNNAGMAVLSDNSKPEVVLEAYTSILNTNVTSVALMINAFTPLLRAAKSGGRVINISSARASLTRSTEGKLPPSVVIPYNVSKTALNMLTVEYSKLLAPEIRVNAASPGHCKTAFNGYRGTKDPKDGAKVVIELAVGKGVDFTGGFWEVEEEDGELRKVEW